MLAFAFGPLGLARVYAQHFPHNPASGAVLRKLGMRLEGTLRSNVQKGDRRLDSVLYGILREEWAPAAQRTDRRPSTPL